MFSLVVAASLLLICTGTVCVNVGADRHSLALVGAGLVCYGVVVWLAWATKGVKP